jgi:UDP-N-acetylmuramoyl-L-alanyl-D-glutamate--2,6-diaminopimelate ligase
MLSYIKKSTPDFIKQSYHKLRSWSAATRHGFPAKSMIVIGVTGTKGKTSTANYIWSVLHAGGFRTGLISSANFRIGEHEELNAYHMTMPDPFIVQRKVSEMKKSGIEILVMEMTSEGMKQYRHIGLTADIAVFTNLTPEHLASHGGSFEKYKHAKSPLFKNITSHPVRTLRGSPVARSIFANADSEHSAFYLQFPADKKHTFGIDSGELRATDIHIHNSSSVFNVDGRTYSLSIPGAFNIYNALPAIGIGRELGVNEVSIAKGLHALHVIPGRMEEISEGQPFRVFVDYAHEPASLTAVLKAGNDMRLQGAKIIVLIGGQGGGRDPRKRDPMANAAARLADYVVVTNEDPYEDSPERIVQEITDSVVRAGKIKDESVFSIMDREEGIKKALSLASKHDIVLITGKGAEQTMMVKGGSIPWNEREVVRNITKTYANNNY